MARVPPDGYAETSRRPENGVGIRLAISQMRRFGLCGEFFGAYWLPETGLYRGVGVQATEQVLLCGELGES